MSKPELVTHQLLKSWGPCISGYDRFCELFSDGTDLKTAIDGLVADGHDDWGFWLFAKCRDNGMFKDVTDKGYQNSGHRNSGDQNSGDQNSGHRNSGDRNSGHRNSGDRNSGDQNSGDQNSGHQNSGHRNSGDQNSGHWNSGDQNSGHFNLDTPSAIRVFGKDCPVSMWDAAYKPAFLYFDPTYWVPDSQMTDEEKKADPNFFVRGGQLRRRDYKEAFKLSWDGADPKDRERVRELPNFDAEIFYQISGIDLR